jgi:serine/threonine protein kinase
MITPGETISNKYKILKELGHGGMAYVYLAEDISLGRNVAVKVLPQIAITDTEAVRSFINEAKKAAALSHPNIVTIYTVDTLPDGQPYFAIEYLKENLSLKIKAGQMRPAEKIKAVSEVLKGLAYAHEKGVIHRDIKPENIMFNDAGEAVIIDFGIAKGGMATKTLTSAGLTKGTPHYMSPEQCKGQKLDARSDLYSLGIVLYEALTGQVPFDAEETTALMYLHVHEPPDLEKLSRADVDKRLIGVVKKVLSKKPEDRFQNASEFLAALNGSGARETETAVYSNINEGRPSSRKTNSDKKIFVMALICLMSLLAFIYYKKQFSLSAPDNSKAGNLVAQPPAAVKTSSQPAGGSDAIDRPVQAQKNAGNPFSGAPGNSRQPEPAPTKAVAPVVKNVKIEPQSARVNAGERFDMDTVRAFIVFSDGSEKALQLKWRPTNGNIANNMYTAPASAGADTLIAGHVENGVELTTVFKIDVLRAEPEPTDSNEKETAQKIGQFIKDFVQLSDYRQVPNYYCDYVFYDGKNMSVAEIQKEYKDYFSKLLSRQFNIDKFNYCNRLQNGSYEADYVVDFKVENKSKIISGKSYFYLKFRDVDGVFKIYYSKEVVPEKEKTVIKK